MGSIFRLPDDVANQIAAGEVVERPASAVKELVENALDARATRIEVAIEGGGTGLIRVSDDGLGMSREDALLCLERHATSKIRSAHDLETVLTMGFRGEALPSIASVSRFVLTTRRAEDEVATRIRVEGGQRGAPVDAGAPKGTTVEVSDLFYNVPARRKFLKTPSTEMSHLTDAVVRLALARPDVGFRLLAEGRSLIDAPPEQGDDPRGRLGRILGRPVADRLFPIVPDSEPRRITVHGFVAAPDVSERTSRGLYVFVNGRFVRERTAQHAIQEAYRPLLEKGRYPVVILFLELDPRTLDVNVHPQKTEVRFQSSTDVHRAITAALGRTLQPAPWLAQRLGPAPAPERVYRLADPSPSGLNLDEPRTLSPAPHPAAFVERSRSLHPPPRPPAFEGKARARYLPDLGFGFGLRDRDPNPVVSLPIPARPPAPAELGPFSALEPIGQALGSYLVCQAPGRLVLIDQQVAHERVGFARLKAAQAERATAIQPLLVPLTLELDPTRARTMEAERERLLAVGFELEAFGGGTWILKSAPAALGGVELAPLVIDLLDELASLDAATPLEERLDRLLLHSARHAAIKSGARLTPEEIRALLAQLDEVGAARFGPLERPLFVEWTGPELARLFYKS